MSRKPAAAVSFILVRGDERQKFGLSGRDAWALSRLISAGAKGVTPITEPGPRWSGYVHNLRRTGLSIETRPERHGGPFPGTHARYVLHDDVRRADPDGGGANGKRAR
ncbi:MAG: hypothetical protein ACJA0K_002524 [Maricaulis maris]|jgi:hypothetical protein